MKEETSMQQSTLLQSNCRISANTVKCTNAAFPVGVVCGVLHYS